MERGFVSNRFSSYSYTKYKIRAGNPANISRVDLYLTYDQIDERYISLRTASYKSDEKMVIKRKFITDIVCIVKNLSVYPFFMEFSVHHYH